MGIKNFLFKKIFFFLKPRMRYGYKRRRDKKQLPKTRISSSTFIEGEKFFFIEDNVYIGHHNYIDASNNLYIKTGVQITNFVSILTHSSHVSLRLYGAEYMNVKNPDGYDIGEVHIGEYSFIGPYSVIMPGTKIGKGCIVKAYSYLRGEFKDFSVIAGNPAKVTGDTRKIDKKYLKQNPGLKGLYEEWAKK